MKYLIPIAGSEGLFPRSEFHFPKPLIEIGGKPMIAWVIDNIRASDPDAEFVFIARKADCAEFSMDRALQMATDGRCTIVMLDRPTAGAACSALMAIEHINPEQPLVVCNGDQVLDADIGAALKHFQDKGYKAGVITFPSVHPRWSFVRSDDDQTAIETAEKRVISRRAIAGFYYYAKGADFIKAAQSTIRHNRDVDGLFYISPTMNEIVLEGGQVGIHDIPAEAYHSFYSPQRLEQFERELQSKTITSAAVARRAAADRVTVVIPMAGLGSRFAKEGYKRPKPFIDVGGKPMIERVMDNLRVANARFVLLARGEHMEQEAPLVAKMRSRGDIDFVAVDKVTEGAACTVLLAREHIDPDTPLLIANCDQIVDFSCDDYVRDCRNRRLDGSILVFRDADRDPKWSFARLGPTGFVTEVREKEAISNLATVGLYYFSRGGDYVSAAIDMIVRNERVNNEFYVCPVYNYAIASGRRVGVYEIPREAMHGIGTPDDLKRFLALRYPK